MQAVTLKKLSDFLWVEFDYLISEWSSKIIIAEDDPCYVNKTECIGKFMKVMLKIIAKPDDELDAFIKKCAIEIGESRVKSESNIGDFVYNVSIGRSVISSKLGCLDVEWDQLHKAMDHINYCFDQFLHYAVSYYSEHKDKIIEEKNEFINSTHKDRLTLLGQMTSSFIHEFRNPLTSIQGFIQLLQADHPNMPYLEIIKNELEQLNFRISQFLLLSKKEIIGKEKTRFSMNHMIEEVLAFLYPSILDANVEVIKKMPEELEMTGYQDEIRQVLINIIFNAVDVLSQYREDPMIEIQSQSVNDTHLKLKISNNGPAIPDRMLKSIFEPFVTTKTLGTGLGLFVSREIIEKHKGFLACSSVQDRTEFMILLPLAKETPAP